jgi:acyl-CoA thioesterase FadM|tara:strand:- start:15464 stop:15958 length:495 start_codon:yes stop_codon:yes gene_type:complete
MIEPIDLSSLPLGCFLYQTDTHYDDLDGQMVVHHPKYLTFVERAQQLWFESVLGAPRFDWEKFPDMYHVVSRIESDYLSSINGVVPISIVLWCQRLRAGSMTTGFAIQSGDKERLYARGFRTNCRISAEDHRPLIWTDSFLERFGELEAQALASGLGAWSGRHR